MTRRLTLAIVGVVVATLLVAVLATVALGRANATRATERSLRSQAANIQQLTAIGLRGLGVRDGGAQHLDELRGALGQDPCGVVLLRRVLQVEAVACTVVGPDGAVRAGGGGALPRGVPQHVDVDKLARGEVLSGSGRGRVWAATALLPRSGLLGSGDRDGDLVVALLTREVTSAVNPVRGWLFVAAGLAVALGVAVAVVLGRRLARPVAAAEVAASRLAAGDLSVRLPEPPAGTEPDELGRLARSLNQLATSLEHARLAEQRFLLSVSHDLRTPLTSIRGYADALADGTLTDVDRGAAVIQQEAARLERLVRDLLDLARLEARQFRLEPQLLDLAEVARRAVSAWAAPAASAGVHLSSTLPDQPVAVVGDPDRLGQVAANLVENALKYAASRVEVAAGADGAGPWLTVADDGPGIAEDEAAHVFDRLYVGRSKPTREEVGASLGGSGLGLAIVRELVGLHGGAVAAEPVVGGGTRILVRLPAVAPAAGTGTGTGTGSGGGAGSGAAPPGDGPAAGVPPVGAVTPGAGPRPGPAPPRPPSGP